MLSAELFKEYIIPKEKQSLILANLELKANITPLLDIALIEPLAALLMVSVRS